MIPFSKFDIEDFLRQTATDIIIVLIAPPSTTTLNLQVGDPIRNTLLQLATLLQRVENTSDSKFTKPNQDPTTVPMFTKPNQDPTQHQCLQNFQKIPPPLPCLHNNKCNNSSITP